MAGIAHARSSSSRYTIASGDVSVAVFYGTWVSHIYDDDEVRRLPYDTCFYPSLRHMHES